MNRTSMAFFGSSSKIHGLFCSSIFDERNGEPPAQQQDRPLLYEYSSTGTEEYVLFIVLTVGTQLNLLAAGNISQVLQLSPTVRR